MIFSKKTFHDWLFGKNTFVKKENDLKNLSNDISRLPFKIITEDYTLTEEDYIIYINSSIPITIFVPDAVLLAGKRFEICNLATGTATAQPIVDGQLIDGETDQAVEQYENLVIDSHGINWSIK